MVRTVWCIASPVCFLLQTIQNYWLSIWSNAVTAWQRSVPEGETPVTPFPVMFYMTWYFGIGLLAMCVQFLSSFILVVATLNASQVRNLNFQIFEFSKKFTDFQNFQNCPVSSD